MSRIYYSVPAANVACDLRASPSLRRNAMFIDQEKLKTRICANFISRGFCKYGGRCVFAHGEQELVTTYVPYCFNIWCQVLGCPYRHIDQDTPYYKITSCVQYEKGSCTLTTDQCPYAHGPEDLRLVGVQTPKIGPAAKNVERGERPGLLVDPTHYPWISESVSAETEDSTSFAYSPMADYYLSQYYDLRELAGLKTPCTQYFD